MIEVQDLTRVYQIGPHRVTALDHVSFQIKDHESAVIEGPSGSGKSTLMHLLGALDRPTSGTVRVNGEDIFKLDDKNLSIFRNQAIGFVFQFFHLQPYLTARQNVALPLLIAGKKPQEAEAEADRHLLQVGMADRAQHLPGQLSGGEQQRIAIARALINNPDLILADEPTGNLDQDNAAMVLDLLGSIATQGISTIIVTHDPTIGHRFGRVIRLQKSGTLTGR